MSLGNWGINLQNAAGDIFGSEYLRDYTHASKTFRTNTYENAPKLKFLFHTYFDINTEAYPLRNNFGLLVKDIRLPSFNISTTQLNQYNRKRIVQTKIRYEPIEISFHDDNGNNITKLWEAYYRYYYNDGSKPSQALQAQRGTELSKSQIFDGDLTEGIVDYNYRDIYEVPNSKNFDWGFVGGNNLEYSDTGIKVPFFNSVTIFGIHNHNFTAYTLINPVITSFSHDTFNYDSGNGTMENKMTLDYETVVYNYGALDGRDPASIVTGFGLEENYDRNPSPIMNPGANGTALGQGGLIDAAGGFLRSAQQVIGAIQTASAAYNGIKNPNLVENAALELTNMFSQVLNNTPTNRNTLFSMPGASQTPGTLGLANSPTVGTVSAPAVISNEPLAGEQFNGIQIDSVEGFPIEAPFGVDPIRYA